MSRLEPLLWLGLFVCLGLLFAGCALVVTWDVVNWGVTFFHECRSGADCVLQLDVFACVCEDGSDLWMYFV